MAAVPVDLLNNAPPDEEDLSDDDVSESMEDETTEESENTNGGGSEIVTEEEFWVKYPDLKNRLGTILAENLLPESFLEREKLIIGDEKAQKLNDTSKALFDMEMELCKERCDLVAAAISVIKKSGN